MKVKSRVNWQMVGVWAMAFLLGAIGFYLAIRLIEYIIKHI